MPSGPLWNTMPPADATPVEFDQLAAKESDRAVELALDDALELLVKWTLDARHRGAFLWRK